MKKESLSNAEAADYLGISPATLNTWRSTKRYEIPYIPVGRRIRYRVEDLDAWLESRRVGGSDAENN